MKLVNDLSLPAKTWSHVDIPVATVACITLFFHISSKVLRVFVRRVSDGLSDKVLHVHTSVLGHVRLNVVDFVLWHCFHGDESARLCTRADRS